MAADGLSRPGVVGGRSPPGRPAARAYLASSPTVGPRRRGPARPRSADYISDRIGPRDSPAFFKISFEQFRPTFLYSWLEDNLKESLSQLI